MRSQQHPPEPPPRRPPSLPFDGQSLSGDDHPHIVAFGTSDWSLRPSRWRRLVARVQYLGRFGAAHPSIGTASVQRRAVWADAPRLTHADPIASIPEPDPMRPSLDLSEVDVAQYPKHYARCRSKDCPCYLAGYDAAYDQADAIAGYDGDGR